MSSNDLDDLPDGTWFATLELAAQKFIDKFNLPRWVDNNSAAHQYLRMKAGRTSTKDNNA